MVDPAGDPSSAPVAPRCPWCSAELPAGEVKTCPSCKANLAAETEAQLPGLTALDLERLAFRRATAPKKSRLMSWISGDSDYENATDPVAQPGSLDPPPFEVRREMLRIEMAALIADLTAEAGAWPPTRPTLQGRRSRRRGSRHPGRDRRRAAGPSRSSARPMAPGGRGRPRTRSIRPPRPTCPPRSRPGRVARAGPTRTAKATAPRLASRASRRLPPRRATRPTLRASRRDPETAPPDRTARRRVRPPLSSSRCQPSSVRPARPSCASTRFASATGASGPA